MKKANRRIRLALAVFALGFAALFLRAFWLQGVMAGSYARRTRAPDYPWGPTKEEYGAWIDQMKRDWGKPFGLDARAPSMAHDERFRDWWAHYLRISASPSAMVTLTRMNGEIDVRHVMPTIRVPTLILHCTGTALSTLAGPGIWRSRYLRRD